MQNPELNLIQDLVDYAKKRADLGELHLRGLADTLSQLPPSQLALVRYHRECRQTVVNKLYLKRAEKRAHVDSSSTSGTQPEIFQAKRGRPQKLNIPGRPQRTQAVAPKEKVCIFSPC